MVRIFIVLLALGWPCIVAHAVTTHNSIFSGKEAIEIEASNGIEWQSDTKQYIARGDAVATRGEFSIKADTLTAKYRDGKEGKPEIYELQANGNVQIQAGEDTASAESAFYNIDDQHMQLTGDIVSLTTSGQKITASKSIEYWADKRLAVATGQASVYRDTYRLTADILRVTLAENSDSGALEIATATAEGNVVLYGEREQVRGSAADYDAKKQIAQIKGNVELVRDDNKLVGSQAEVNLATGVSRLVNTGVGDGRVKGVFRLDALTRD